jgi:hypothetical protein
VVSAARVGLQTGVGKEHWTRVKALSRRLATGMADYYDSLQPVADLRKELQDRIYVFVQNPVKWRGKEPSDDQNQVIFDTFADASYDKRATGSSYVRADIIGTQILGPAAPIPKSGSVDRSHREPLAFTLDFGGVFFGLLS